MSEPGRPAGDEARRVEELLRVNGELAGEIRNLQAGRIDTPRSTAMPAARRVGRLVEEHDALLVEHDALLAERDALLAELDSTRAELAHVKDDRAGLERQSRELAAEVARLSGGAAGFLRRARARLLRR
jgi:hypothetical protein